MLAHSFMPLQIFDLLGFLGFIFYMAAYALLQLGRISGHSYSYTLINLTAATLVLISLVHQFNLASLLIQLAWIVISILGLARLRWFRCEKTEKKFQITSEFHWPADLQRKVRY